MFKEWVKPVLFVMLKFLFALAVLAGVWVASGVFHARAYVQEADAQIRIRVRQECLRPDYVKTPLGAREFDVTESEIQVVKDKTDVVSRRLENLIERADKIEETRKLYTQGKVPGTGGVGGPAPKKTKPKP